MLLRPSYGRRRRRVRTLQHASSPASSLESLENRRLLTTFTVASSADTFDAFRGDGIAADVSGATTLRAAVQEANARSGADTINLGAGTYFLNIAGFDDDAIFGDLDITDNLTITGAGASQTIIDGNDLDRILHVRPGVSVIVSGVTIRNGNAVNAGGILNEGFLSLTDSIVENNEVSGASNSVGGGIGNLGVLNLDGVTVRGNTATINGGGLYNSGGAITIVDSVFMDNAADGDGGGLSIFNGSLTFTGGAITNNTAGFDGGGLSLENAPITLTDVSVTGNTAGDDGGGLNVFGLGNLQVRSSTISDNTATDYGGGVHSTNAVFGLLDSTVSNNSTGLRGGGLDNDNGTTEIINSLFSGNSAGTDGGGINNFNGTLGLSNSTLSGNTATRSGGGIFNPASSTATLVNATITANAAGFGGGVDTGGLFRPANTLIAKNTADASGNDVLGALTTLGNNLLGQINGSSGLIPGLSGDLAGSAEFPFDPLLGPLTDNGGPTLSHALLEGSPAIDAGNIDGAARFDQTGGRRNRDGNFDGRLDVDIGAVEYLNSQSLFVVNTTADTFDVFLGDEVATDFNGNISLRSAIQESNSIFGEARIELPAGTFPLTIAGINEDFAVSGDLDITDTLTIVGAGRDSTFIDAGTIDRVFHVFPGVSLTLIDLTVRNGLANFGGGIYSTAATVTLQDVAVTGNAAINSEFANGGGIANDAGILNLERATVSGNSAEVDGGGIYSFNGVLNVTDSLIASNSAADDAGGIGQFGGTMNIAGSTIELNTATVNGGGIGHHTGLSAINDSIIRKNVAGDADAGIAGSGGGLLVRSAISVVTNSTVTANTATNDGGGIAVFTTADVRLESSTVSSNSAADFGGGVHSESSLLTVTESTVSNNSAVQSGGGINNETGTLTVRRSTIHSNSAGADGGGIDNFQGVLAIRHSTISGNMSEQNGGGIVNFDNSTVELINATVVDNTANGRGGGIWTSGVASIGNSIVARNIGVFQDVAGTITSLGNSLVGINAGNSGAVDGVNSDIVGTFAFPVDPLLSELADHGGPTLSHRPLAASPAIDGGVNVVPVQFMDQRGFDRAADGDQDGIVQTDIGAVEINPVVFDATISGSPLRVVRVGDSIQIQDDFDPVDGGPVPRLLLDEPINSVDQIVITGGSFDDSVRIDFSGGDPVPSSGIIFDGVGFGGIDLLTISGTGENITHRPTSPFDGTINVDGSVITYINIETLVDALTTTVRSIDFGVDADSIVIADNDTTDDGILTITSATVGATLQFFGQAETVSITGSAGNDTIRVEALDSQFTGSIRIDAGAGDDTVDATAAGVAVSVRGGAGDDTIRTGSGDDRVDGEMGRDLISTGAGNDSIYGGAAADTIDGGDGNDLINAQGGSGDRLTGGLGDDTLRGGGGKDAVFERGDVNFVLTNGSLTGLGNDVLVGVEAARLTGGSSANTIDATRFSGQSTLDGGSGNDLLIGGRSADRLLGRDGNDTLQGGGGRDALLGGDGDDSLQGDNGHDILRGGEGNDSLDGGAGKDTLKGDAGNDLLLGGDGNDGLSGGDGDDTVNGQMGRDTLLGGDGNDCLFGGGGADVAIGGLGVDTVSGNAGNDLLVGGIGNGSIDPGDTLNGVTAEIDEFFQFAARWVDA